MRVVLLVALVLAGCGRGRREAPEPRCDQRATVRVLVDNTGSPDVRVTFGSYTPARAAPGLSQTTYDISRHNLRGNIQLRIMRGGMQVGPPAVIVTEPVICNDATLVIGARLDASFFYGYELTDLGPDSTAGAMPRRPGR